MLVPMTTMAAQFHVVGGFGGAVLEYKNQFVP
jgi:hypothetical protein